MTSSAPLFLGLDSSTQGLKATAVDERLGVVHRFAINYQKEFASYGIVNGVQTKAGNVVTQPTLMYIDALEKLFNSMKEAGFPFERIAAVSGSGQQHGSMYWAKGAQSTLRGIKPGSSLTSQLKDAFSIRDNPIWMDSSTTEQCRGLEAALGGPRAVAEATGSRAYERFTGNQIVKIATTQAAAYAQTERISLISSGMCSVLLGDYAPIDTSDGCGMNLLDLRRKVWAPSVLAAVASKAPGLADKLGPVAHSHAIVGKIHPYFSAQYGFSPSCDLVAWSGDNPCSVAGLGLRAPGDVAISLGTSDTMFGITNTPTPGEEGHLFANPVDPDSYMAMLCYKNGSLTRERVKDAVAGGSWKTFAELVEGKSKPGNDGNIGFYFDSPEITPTVLTAGTRRFALREAAFKKTSAASAAAAKTASFDPAAEARAVLESQFISMRSHGESIGIKNPKRLIATGGASANPTITQVLADVFGAPVYVAAQTDSASLGAAFRAAHGWRSKDGFVPFEHVLKNGTGKEGTPSTTSPISLEIASVPRASATAVYDTMIDAFRAAEEVVVKS